MSVSRFACQFFRGFRLFRPFLKFYPRSHSNLASNVADRRGQHSAARGAGEELYECGPDSDLQVAHAPRTDDRGTASVAARIPAQTRHRWGVDLPTQLHWPWWAGELGRGRERTLPQ